MSEDKRIGGLCLICGKPNIEHGNGCPKQNPITRDMLDAILAKANAEKAKRAADMPTEEDAVRAMCSAYHRLKELGWNDTCYAPTEEMVRVVEPGSAGIHTGSRPHHWPSKTWWIHDAGDLWPGNPCLFKAIPKDQT